MLVGPFNAKIMSIATFRLAREAEEAKLKAEQEAVVVETAKEPEPVVQKVEPVVKTVSTTTASMKAKPKTTLKSEA